MHYSRFKRGGDPLAISRKPPSNYAPTVCAVPACERTAGAQGYCLNHRRAFNLYGDPLARMRGPYTSGGAKCRLPNCDRRVNSGGLCAIHHYRLVKHGDPYKTLRRANGTGFINPQGYRGLTLPDGRHELEHRMVWMKANGPIPKGMVLHHINGVRLDNRLENLQIMTRSDHMKLHHPKVTGFCSEPGCSRPLRVRGLCDAHYQRLRYRKRERQHKYKIRPPQP